MTLDDIKRDLRVTHADDDALLLTLLESAQDQARRFIGQNALPSGGSVKTATILLVRCLYDAADAKEIEATRKVAETMLMPYRTGLGA